MTPERGWCAGLASGALLLALAGAGCAPVGPPADPWHASLPAQAQATNRSTPKPASSATPAKAARPAPKPVTLAPQPTPAVAPPRYPLLTAVEQSVGRVTTVNTQALFVVVDFGFNPLPRPDQRLTVFRTNQPVGILRMTGIPRSGLMAADIMSGEARVGDEVRKE